MVVRLSVEQEAVMDCTSGMATADRFAAYVRSSLGNRHSSRQIEALAPRLDDRGMCNSGRHQQRRALGDHDPRAVCAVMRPLGDPGGKDALVAVDLLFDVATS
jgi:hypothetical protein